MDTSETIEAMGRDLAALGVRQGGLLLVHSSLKSLGPVPGGPETVVRALLAALGPSGTLLMPALSYKSVTGDHPLFDPATTPSCVGAIPEYFRHRPGTLRSIHPTHSVCAVGARAQEITASHHLDRSPVGANSPFRLLRDHGGKVLMLGCGLKPNTSMHGVEELSEPPYLLLPHPIRYTICTTAGQRQVEYRVHNFRGWAQCYDRLPQVMTSGLSRGMVLQADCWLIDADEMWRCGGRTLRGNPYYFVEPNAP